MDKVSFFKILLVLSIFIFLLFLTPSFAEITFQPRVWNKACIHPDQEYYNSIKKIVPEFPCEDTIDRFIDIEKNEIELNKIWKFKGRILEEFFDYYILSDLNLTRISDGISLGKLIYNPNNNTFEFEVEFVDEWKTGEGFKIGKHSVTYESSTNVIILVANSTHGTASNPYTFFDIYNEDVSNTTWNCTEALNETSFGFSCKIQVGNGTIAGRTFFNDTNVSVLFEDIDDVSYDKPFTTTRYSYVTLGKLLNATERSSTTGVQFIVKFDHNTPSWHQPPYIFHVESSGFGATDTGGYVYSSSFIATKSISTVWCDGRYIDSRIYNTHFINVAITRGSDDNFNLLFTGGANTLGYGAEPYEDITVYDSDVLLWTQQNYVFDVKNVYVRDVTYMGGFAGNWVGEGNLTNVDSDNWAFDFSAGLINGTIFRQYDFDLRVINETGDAISGTTLWLNSLMRIAHPLMVGQQILTET